MKHSHLLNSFRLIKRSEIVNVFSFTALSTLVKTLTGFISIKIVAIIVGPLGIALLGQLNNFSSIVMTIASGGINNGITKYIAEFKNSPKKLRLFISTAFQITLILSLISGIGLILFANYFSRKILVDISYSYVFLFFGITITLYTLNSFLMSILNGYKEFKKFVQISIVTSIIGALFTIGLVWIWELPGALISAVTYQGIVFFITLFLVSKYKWFIWSNFITRLSKPILKKYTGFALMALVTAITVPLTQLFVRSFIITELSVNDAGIWEGINRISGMYLMIITSSFGVYYLPRLSEIKDKNELKKEIFTAYKLIIPILIIGCIGIYISRDLIIKILFSPEFYSMRDLFFYQLIGDVFKICSWLLAFLMIAKTMTKLYVVTEIISSIFFVCISIILIKRNHIEGVTQSYMITYFIYFFLMIFIFRKILFWKTNNSIT